MAALNTKEIKELGKNLVLANPGGIRFKDIVNTILKQHPETTKNTVIAQIANSLVQAYPTQITKPTRGLYVPIKQDEKSEIIENSSPQASPRESDFYDAFAEYLKDDLDEVTSSVAVGGATLQKKWGTPDVVGVYRPLTSDLIKFTPEIIAAEIKIDVGQSVVAFGQAIAYRLFATKSYIVMPSTMAEDEQSRLEALCMLFGIGFVLFDSGSPQEPNFRIRVRAQGFTPDAFYANEFARRLQVSDPDTFEKLFD